MAENIEQNRSLTYQRVITSGDVFPISIDTNIQYAYRSDVANIVNVELWSLINPTIVQNATGDIQSDGFTISNLSINTSLLEVGRIITGSGIPANSVIANIVNSTTIQVNQYSTPATGITFTITKSVNSINPNDFTIRGLINNTANGGDYDYIFVDAQGNNNVTGDIRADYINTLIIDNFKIKLINLSNLIPNDGNSKIVVSGKTVIASDITEANITDPYIKMLARNIYNINKWGQELEQQLNSYLSGGSSNIFLSEISDLDVDARNPKKSPSRLFLTNYNTQLQNTLATGLFFDYNSGTSYLKFSIVKNLSNGRLFRSRKGDYSTPNKGNGLNNTEWWVPYDTKEVGEWVHQSALSSSQSTNPLYIRPIGQYLNQSDYPDLFSLWVTTYGATVGNTFKCPDSRNRILISRDENAVDGYQTIGNYVGNANVSLSNSSTNRGNGTGGFFYCTKSDI